MRKRFTRAFYAASAAAVVTVGLAAGVSPAVAGTHAKKGTVACGYNCFNLFSDSLGSSVTQNAYINWHNPLGGRVGTKVNLHLAGNNRPNGDFIATDVGQVFQFCGNSANDFFSPTSYVCLNYPTFDVFQVSRAPFGTQQNLCVGVRNAVWDADVTLQTCGVSPNTVWIADRAQATRHIDCRIAVPNFLLPVPAGDPHINYCPWINGGDTSFAPPLVLTLDTGTRHPTNQLQLEPELLNNGVTSTNQLFAFYYGAVPS